MNLKLTGIFVDLNEMDEYFAYTKWLSDAMVDVFRKTLSSLSNKLPEDNHHLYINFLTKSTGVKYPEISQNPISQRHDYRIGTPV